jgi:PAS domain S-box-containing protein
MASARPILGARTWEEDPPPPAAWNTDRASHNPVPGAKQTRSAAQILFALLVTAVFALFELATWPLLQASPFLLFCAGAVIAASVAGLKGGVVTTLTSASIAQYLFATPQHHLLPGDAKGALSLAGFLATGILISMLVTRLERDRARMARVLDSVGDGFVSIDRDGRYRYVNEAAAALDGRRPEDLLGQPFDLIPGTSLEDQGGEREAPRRTEVYVPRLERWLDVSLYPLDDGATLLFRDVTERHEVEEALRQSERRIRALLDQSIMGVAQIDLSGRFLLANRRFCDIVGRSEPALLGLRLHDVSHPLDRAEGIAAFAGLAERGESGVVEKRFRRPDGTIVWVRNHLVAVRDSEGHAQYALAIVEDVTDRKTAERENDAAHERERAARSEAESASRAKDEFLAMISHELRAPLTSILGWIRLLHSEPLDAAGTPRALETIERNARVLSQIVGDLLDVSRIVSGKLELDKKPIDPEPVVRAAVDVVRPLSQRKQIEIVVRAQPGVGPVLADVGRLHQILWNLLANAVKFTPHGGRVDVTLEADGDDVITSIADNGIGIRPEFLPYVFDRFRQSDSSYSRRHTGLGLGLAIAHHLTEMHDGSVEARSAGEGQGSTFVVRMPRARVETGRTERSDPAESNGSQAERLSHPNGAEPEPRRMDRLPSLAGLRVLVVDDEPDARALVVEILARRGAVVRSCPTAGEGRALFEEWVPDVLISDIGLPEESGYSLIKSIRALGHERGGDVPAIALTGYARLANRLEALSAGYDLHIAKPVEPSDLILMVASVAGRLEEGPLGHARPSRT